MLFVPIIISSYINGSLNSKKIPSFGIENIFTGNPFCIVNNGSDVISVQTDWDIDNGGYRVKNIKYPAGTATNLTVSLSLPANSIVIVDVNTLNGENIDIQGSLIRSNFNTLLCCLCIRFFLCFPCRIPTLSVPKIYIFHLQSCHF